jgi:hypothetical protein
LKPEFLSAYPFGLPVVLVGRPAKTLTGFGALKRPLFKSRFLGYHALRNARGPYAGRRRGGFLREKQKQEYL